MPPFGVRRFTLQSSYHMVGKLCGEASTLYSDENTYGCSRRDATHYNGDEKEWQWKIGMSLAKP